MTGRSHADRGVLTAVVLVRNAVDHDSRVLREARALRSLGLDTTVLGVVSFTQTRQVTEHDGIPVRRIGPRSRVGWAVYREISSLRPPEPSAEHGPVPGGAAGPSEPGRSAFTRRVRARLRGVAGKLSPARGPARRLLRGLSTLAYYAWAIAEVRRLRPDLVHCNDYNTMWIGVAARIAGGSAVVYDSHELWPDRTGRSEARAWLLACEALFTRLADRLVTTSPAYAEVLARRYRIGRPAVVRNIPELARESGSSTGAADGIRSEAGRTAVYAGGLQPGRGIEQAIRALPLVPEASLRLLGPGAPEYAASLRKLVLDLGVDDRVEFAEPVPPSELLEALRGSDAGLALIEPTSLSYRLTLPNKLFEYTLAGLPTVGSDMPMISRFVLEQGVGVVVDPADVREVAAALREVLDPDRNRAYRLSAARAAERLDWSSECAVLEGVYRQALLARGRPLAPTRPAPVEDPA